MIDAGGGPPIFSIVFIVLSIGLILAWFATVIHAFRHDRPAFGFLMAIFPPLVILYWVPTLPERRRAEPRSPSAR